MDAFFRSIPVLLIFPTLAALAWIRGGTHGDLLVPTVPWLLTLVFEVLICFPQRHAGEDAVQARQRCWRRVGRDPVFFLTLLFLVVVLGVAFLNKGLCPTCDLDAILKSLSPEECRQLRVIGDDLAPAPPIPFVPFCVHLRDHFEVLMWFLPALTAMLAARHALLRHGKRMLVEMLVWNAAALAAFGFVQRATGAKFVMMWDQAEYDAFVVALRSASGIDYMRPDPDFFATFGYPNKAGCFFVLAFALSLSVWMTRVREVEASGCCLHAWIGHARSSVRFSVSWARPSCWSSAWSLRRSARTTRPCRTGTCLANSARLPEPACSTVPRASTTTSRASPSSFSRSTPSSAAAAGATST